ncbi:MAG: glycosyltransferase [Desulfomonilaceae bacterium]
MQPRILIVSAQGSSSTSAYTYRLMSLAHLLEERNFHCDYFFMEDHPPLDTETTRSIFMPFWGKQLRNYDLIYCGASEAAQGLFFVKPFFRGTILMDMHGDVVSQSILQKELATGGKKHAPYLRVLILYKMSMMTCDYFITQSNYQMEDLIKEGVKPANVSVVRNGVDLNLFRFMEMPQKPEFQLGYIGAFQTWQGTEYLFEAIGLMKNDRAKILLIGFDDSETHWKNAFKQAYGERVEVFNKMQRSELVKKMNSTCVLMSPRPPHIASRAAFPTKFAEYASLGRPILVTEVDETADYVRKYNCGFICKAASQDLANAMDAAVETPMGTLAQMGRNARSMAEANFSWDKIGDQYAELVRKLLQNK